MKKAGLLFLVVVQLLVIIGFWAYYHVNHQMGNQLTGDMMGRLLAWGRLAGLLAAFGVLFQLILIGRVRWVEGVFGLDRLTRLHHVLGFGLVVFLLSHSILLTMGHAMQAGSGPVAQFVDFCKNWDDVLAAVIGMDLMIAAILISVCIVIKKLRYETWYATHLFLYLALALAFGHQLAVGSDFADNRWFKIYWYVLYVFVLLNMVIYRFIFPVMSYAMHKFKVARLVQESGDVTSVYIEGKDLEKYPVRAGQFLIVRFLAKGFRGEAHPFSMSCCPDGKQIRLTIKQLGDFTKKIPELQPGTPVLIDGPNGIFTAVRSETDKVLMVAGGIGITPLRSVAEEMVATGKDIVMIYGNRNGNLIVFKKELDDLVGKSQGRLKVVHVMSDDQAWQGEKGRIDRERIERLVPDAKERDVFLCGPPVMMKAVRAALAEMDIPSSRIYYERFAL